MRLCYEYWYASTEASMSASRKSAGRKSASGKNGGKQATARKNPRRPAAGQDNRGHKQAGKQTRGQGAGDRKSGGQRPNFLILCMDQWDTHMQVPDGVDFPAMRRLEAQGVSFDRQYCTVPICTP